MKLLFLATLAVGASARVVPVTLYGPSSERVPNEYIVRFNKDAAEQFSAFKFKGMAHSGVSDSEVFEFSDYRAFSARLNDAQLAEVQQIEGVEAIEPNIMMHALGEQTNVPAWGIDRADQRTGTNSRYRWTDGADGAGAAVYVLDTGVLDTHEDFGGRAHFLTDCSSMFGSSCSSTGSGGDGNGHGTHCAGSVGSDTYGIAKNATIFNVQVLTSYGSGSTNGIVRGIEQVVNHDWKGPKIISMSLGGGASPALDAAVDSAFRAGVLSVVATGNSNNNGCNGSPAGASTAFTVSATDIDDAKASFSSYGPCVDIWAPGVDILSTWNDGTTNSISGTSMATPHVAGAAALIASRGIADPALIAAQLVKDASPDAVAGCPPDTPNRLLFTDPQ